MTVSLLDKPESCGKCCRSHDCRYSAKPEPADYDALFEDVCNLVFNQDQVTVLKSVLLTQPEQFSSSRDIVAKMIEQIHADMEGC